MLLVQRCLSRQFRLSTFSLLKPPKNQKSKNLPTKFVDFWICVNGSSLINKIILYVIWILPILLCHDREDDDDVNNTEEEGNEDGDNSTTTNNNDIAAAKTKLCSNDNNQVATTMMMTYNVTLVSKK